MNGYLLDTNICIYYFKGLFDIENKIDRAGWANCFISEITVAELKYGAAGSDNPTKRNTLVDVFISRITTVPIADAIDIYAEEKARMKKAGNLIDDFDLLIGATAVAHKLVMVTNNTTHFSRLKGIKLEDWKI